MTSSDSGTLGERVNSVVDFYTFAETVSISVTLSGSDSATETESNNNPSGPTTITSSDSATLSQIVSLGLTTTESGSMIENISAALSPSDSFAFADIYVLDIEPIIQNASPRTVSVGSFM